MLLYDLLKDGRTALGLAIDCRHSDCAVMLVAAGANDLTSQVSY